MTLKQANITIHHVGRFERDEISSRRCVRCSNDCRLEDKLSKSFGINDVDFNGCLKYCHNKKTNIYVDEIRDMVLTDQIYSCWGHKSSKN